MALSLNQRSSAAPLAAVYAALVLYASWYPFTGWRWPPGPSLGALLALPWPPWRDPFDVWSNVLGYVPLGQPLSTLSGGEAQRLKLAGHLAEPSAPGTLFLFDEPTTGLHFADIALLLRVLHQLRDAGNTIVVIEHNLDVIKTADWLIDMGPEGGSGGGTVVGVGTPETLAQNPASFTGRYLKRLLEK